MSPIDNNNNNEQNIFDQAATKVEEMKGQAGEFLQGKKDETAAKAQEVKDQAQLKMDETKKAAQEHLDTLEKSEADKKEAGEQTLGQGIGNFFDSAKDTTGKVINDAKTKIEEALSDNKKN